MSRKLFMIVTSLVVQPLLAAPPPVAPPKKAPVTVVKKFQFFGQDTEKWLPQTKNLPSASDVERIGQKLSSRVRNLDPFAIATFPREDAEVRIIVEDPSRPTPKVTLNQALQTLKLNGVNLVNKEFLIGGRSVFEGDIIEIAFQKETFQALVNEISATEIQFTDLIRNETGVMPHTMIPHLQMEPLRAVVSSLESRMVPLEPQTPVEKTPASPKKSSPSSKK